MDKVCKCCIDNECECKGTSLISAIWPEPVVVETPSLSDDARAVIAGLIADGSEHDINKDGITASDAVWSEIRAAFPIELFRAWATDDNYNPHAGY